MSKKAHELIAVQGDLTAKTKAILLETFKAFSGKPELFLGSYKATKAYSADRSQGIDAEEFKDLTTTVPERIGYTLAVVKDEINARASLDATNCLAKADLIIDGAVLATGIPAVSLLLLEQQCGAWLELFTSAPTLANGVAWELDPDKGPDIYVTKHPIVRTKTEKVSSAVVLAPATQQHPAQVKEVVNDVPVASITETQWSGMVSSAYKHGGAEKVQKLKTAAKEARQRANNQEVVISTLGDVVFNYLMKS